jgi:ankyrin repeat protein
MLNKIYLSLSLFFCISSLTVSSQNIHQLVEGGNIQEIKELIEEEPGKLHAANQYGRSPLMVAAGVKNLKLMEYLLNIGADIQQKDNWGNDALNIAVSSGFKDGAGLLLDHDANINTQNRWNIAPLHYAVNSENTTIAKFLLEKGADPNLSGHWGTPLQIAIKKEHHEVVELLFEFNVNPNVPNSVGNTAAHTAIYSNNPEILKDLIRKGTDLDKTNAIGYKPAHIAAICGYTSMLRILESYGVNLPVSNNERKGVDYYARYYHHPELIEFFEETGIIREEGFNEDAYTLKPEPSTGQAKVFYLGHSGWAVETESHYLVFDYYSYLSSPAHPSLYNGNINLSELDNKPLFVFVSHQHGDHYDPVIYEWEKEREDITFIFGWEAHQEGDYICYKEPYQEKKIGKLWVRNVICDDGGSAFLVHVDGLSIYHSGDYTGNMAKDMDFLSSFQERVDIAFVGMGYREVSNYTLERLKPVIAFPMHQRLAEYKYQIFKEEVAPLHPEVEVIAINNKGDRHFYPSEE